MELQDSRAIFTTAKMIVEVKDGAIVRLYNRETGNELVKAGGTPDDSALTSAVLLAEPKFAGRQTNGPVPLRASGDKTPVYQKTPHELSRFVAARVRKLSNQAVRYEFGDSGSDVSYSVNYSLDPECGDLVIQQEARSEKVPLCGVRWGIGPVICPGNLLIPVFGGIKANRSQDFLPTDPSEFDWPMLWQLPLAIFDGVRGGFWIHTQDPQYHFKSFSYRHHPDGAWSVAFDTENAAPFQDKHTANSVAWRLNVYSGDWRVPLDDYREWAYTAYELTEKAKSFPAWTKEIRLELRDADNMPREEVITFLDQLCRHVDPARTLLYTAQWRGKYIIDTIPDWRPSEYGVYFMNEAQKRGFRVMVYLNMLGMSHNHPQAEQLRPYFVRNAYTHEYEGWNLRHEWTKMGAQPADMMLYYINNASREWRKLQIDALRQLFAACKPDGLFLDQSYHVYNDDNGTIDGMNPVEGNTAIAREIMEAFPGIALAGESINEICMQHQAFCELHLLSMNMDLDEKGQALGWSLHAAAIDRMVPLMTRYLLPHTRIMGAFPLPDVRSPYYPVWRDALSIYADIPALSSVTLADLQDPDSEVHRVFAKAFGR